MKSPDPFRDEKNQARNLNLSTGIPSDQLPFLREFLSMSPALQKIFGELIQLRIVIDADIAQKELIWRLSKRRNPTARTALNEAIDSGVVVAFAPTFLEEEIRDHVIEIAERANVPVSRVLQEWQQFKSRLYFYEPEPITQPDSDCVDPDDLPYKWICDQLGAHAVYSTDRHFQNMSVPLISVQLDLTVREYARANSIRLTLHLGATYSLIIGFGVLRALCQSCVQILKRLPIQVRIILVVGALVAVIHPKLRATIVGVFKSLQSQVGDLKPSVGKILIDLLTEAAAAESTALCTHEKIQSLIPHTRKLPAVVRARAICLVSKKPLSLEEIEARMAREGYVSKSKNFTVYLRRLLQKDKRFIEVSAGLWTIRCNRIA